MRRRDFIRTLMSACAAAAGFPAIATEGALRGLYRSGDEFIGIGEFTEFGEGLFLFDYQGTRAGKLVKDASGYRVSATFLDEGETIGSLAPTPAGIAYKGREYRAEAIEWREFAAKSGPVRIAGECAWPAAGAKGVIVPVWGSGPGPHRGLDYWTLQLLAMGWAVVTYDKRGSGASGGDWRVSGFDDLAADLRAVLAHVRARAESAGLAIGLMGLSQGGWIAPMLAREIDFLVLHAAAMVTPAEQTLAYVEGVLKAYGFPEREIAAALAYYALDIDVSRGRRPWAELQRAYNTAAARGAEWLRNPPLPANAPERTMWRLIADFNPAALWRKCAVPVLAIYGEKDLIVPPEPNARLLTEFLPHAIRREIVVLPGANHLGMIADKGVTAEYPRSTRIAPGYFPAQSQWLAERT